MHRIFLVLIALVLLLPTLSIPLRDEGPISQFFNKRLAAFPQTSLLITNPKSYFLDLQSWFNDRVGFNTASVALYRKFHFHILDQSSYNYISKRGNFIFYHGTKEKPFRFIVADCPEKYNSHSDYYTIERIYKRISKSLEKYSARFRVVIIPTKTMIFANHLPRRIPKYLQLRCSAQISDKDFRKHLSETLDHTDVFYPIDIFREKRNDETFYPSFSYHLHGSGARFIAEAYFKHYGIQYSKSGHKFKRKTIRTDLVFLKGYNLEHETEVHDYSPLLTLNPKKDEYTQTLFELIKYSPKVEDYMYITNRTLKNGRRALLLSNSFGKPVRKHLALGYENLMHVNIAQFYNRSDGNRHQKTVTLLRNLMKNFKFTDIILLHQSSDLYTLSKSLEDAFTDGDI
ncbi:MAG: hypothetical protein AAF228_06400 [Pseudomonadota bacterium]